MLASRRRSPIRTVRPPMSDSSTWALSSTFEPVIFSTVFRTASRSSGPSAFALVTTAYILVAIRFEEADLMKEHPEYAVYRRQVPMLVPRITRDVSFAPRVMPEN